MRSHRDYVARAEAEDPAFRAAREVLRPRYELVRALIGARVSAGLSQAELAERLGTTQSAIARLEGGNVVPRLDTLHRMAQALGVPFSITPESPLTLVERPRPARRRVAMAR